MAERPHNFLREGVITGFIGACLTLQRDAAVPAVVFDEAPFLTSQP